MKFISLLFGIGGLVVIIAGIQLGIERYKLFRGGAHAKGKVVDQEVTTAKQGQLDTPRSSGHFHKPETITTYYPIVEFQTKSGETVRFKSNSGTEDFPNPETGTIVDIIYDSRKPSKAQIATVYEFFQQSLAMIAFGLAAGFAGVMGFLTKD